MVLTGLRLVVFELAITHSGGYVFVSADPCGRWLGIEAATGLPITATIADALTATGGKRDGVS